MDKLPYTIDWKNNTIHYAADPDLEPETFEVSELLEMLAWWRSRQGVLRRLIQERDPLPTFSPMTRHGDYYFGECSNMERVKVRREDWDKVMAETERIVRENWLHDIMERRNNGIRGATLQILDDHGRPTQTRDEKGNPIPPAPEWTLEDCPSEIIQAELAKRRDPAWWNVRDSNLSRGQWGKLP